MNFSIANKNLFFSVFDIFSLNYILIISRFLKEYLNICCYFNTYLNIWKILWEKRRDFIS